MGCLIKKLSVSKGKGGLSFGPPSFFEKNIALWSGWRPAPETTSGPSVPRSQGDRYNEIGQGVIQELFGLTDGNYT